MRGSTRSLPAIDARSLSGLTDCALSGPEPSRERLADDDRRRSPSRVGRREVASGDDGNAERREVAGVDDVPGRSERLGGAGLVARSHAAEADAFEATGWNPRERRAVDTQATAGRARSPSARMRPARPSSPEVTDDVERCDVDASRIETRDRRRRHGARRGRTTRRARRAGHCTRSGRPRTRSGGATARMTTARRP